jgi:hypothetical protein
MSYCQTTELSVEVHGVPFRVIIETETTTPDWWEQQVFVDDSERDILPLIEGSPLHDNIIQASGMELEELRAGKGVAV